MPSFVDGETTSAQTLAVKVVSLFDSRDAAWDEAGDLIQPLQSGLIDRHHIHAELGELVLSRKPGRRHDREVTLFKSVGLAAQDAVAAQFALENANRLRIGQHVAW